MRNIIKLSFFLLVINLLFASCEKRDKNGRFKETTTNGSISISADESYRPIIDSQILAFTSKYKYAKINVLYGSEGYAINKLLYDTCRLAIVGRPLSEEEQSILMTQKKFKGKSIKIGVDAIALIINKDNPDSLLTYDQLQQIFTGKIKNWKQINPESSLEGINVIFDNDSAASVRYIKDSVAHVNQLPSNCFAVDSNPKVIDYIAKDKNAIGLIGVSWVSDKDDSVSRGFLKQIKVVALSKPGKSGSDDFYQPFQAYIAQGEYPLTRGIYILNRESGVKLGSGFTSYVASDKGQRIILKAGLVPATMPVRIVKINKDPLKYD